MKNLDLEIGNRVQHPTFGRGTVTDISKQGSEPIAEVNFDDVGKKRLAIKYAKLKKITADGLEDVYQIPNISFEGFWSDPEEDDELHVHGNHWDIFFDDVEGFLAENLQKVIEKSQPATGWGDNHEPLHDVRNDEPEAALLCYPGGRKGIKSVIHIDREREQRKLMSIFPFVSEGIQHTLMLEKVYVWEDRVEAQIEAVVNDVLEITFFDTDYVKHRAFYGPQHGYQFILAGLAYLCRIAEDEPLEVPENTRKIFEKIQEDDPDFEIPTQLSMEGMAAFLPAEGGDRDDFEFRGPVKKWMKFKCLIKPYCAFALPSLAL